jgi:hypothetical protein
VDVSGRLDMSHSHGGGSGAAATNGRSSSIFCRGRALDVLGQGGDKGPA